MQLVRREPLLHGAHRSTTYFLPLQVDKKDNGGDPVEDVCKDRANYVASNLLSGLPGVARRRRIDVLLALFVQPKMPLKINHPWSALLLGLQQLICQTFPRTSNEPGPSPPASSTSAPRLLGEQSISVFVSASQEMVGSGDWLLTGC